MLFEVEHNGNLFLVQVDANGNPISVVSQPLNNCRNTGLNRIKV